MKIKKRLISFLLSVIMCFSCFSQVVAAAENTDNNAYTFKLTLTPAVTTVDEGDVFTVDVTVEGAAFNDYSAKITYDAKYFELLSTSVSDEDGTITLHNVGSEVYPSGTKIATLYFGVKDITKKTVSRIQLAGARADLSVNAVDKDAKSAESVKKNITINGTDKTATCSCTVEVDTSLWGEGETWGTVSVDKESVSKGDSVYLSAVAAAGYQFAGWRVYGNPEYVSTSPYVSMTLEYDTVFTAVFEPAAYDADLSGVTVAPYQGKENGILVVGEAAVLSNRPLSNAIGTYHLYKGTEADAENEIPLNSGTFYMPEDTDKLTLTCSYLSGTNTVTESRVIDVTAQKAVSGVLTRMSATYTGTYAGYFINQSSVDFDEQTTAMTDSATGQLSLYAGSTAYGGVMVDSGTGDKDFNYEGVAGESFSTTASIHSRVYGNGTDLMVYVENFYSNNVYFYADGTWTEMKTLEEALSNAGARVQGELHVYPFTSYEDMLVVYSSKIAYYDGTTLETKGTVTGSNFNISRLDENRVLVSANSGIYVYDNRTKAVTEAGGFSAQDILGTKGSSVFCKTTDGVCLLNVDSNTVKTINVDRFQNVMAMNYAVDGYIYAITNGIYNMASWASGPAIALECPYYYIWRTSDYGETWEFISYDNRVNTDSSLDAYNPDRDGTKNDDTPMTPDPIIYPQAARYIVNPCEGVTLFVGDYGSMYAIYGTRTISFDTGDGSAVQPISASINSIISAPENPTNGSKHFAGWYTDAACTEGNEYAFYRMPTKNITLYAKWTEAYDPAYDRAQALQSLEEAYAGYTSSDYSKAEWTELTGYYTEGKDSINAAETQTGIAAALDTAVKAMAGVTASNFGKITVTLSVEKLTIDGEYILEPTLVSVDKGTTVSKLVTDQLKVLYPDVEQPWRMTGSVGSSFYMQSVYDPGYVPDATKGQVQNYEGFLSEFDGGEESGWMYCVNGSFPGVGASAWKLEDGDVVRWQYTCTGLGADIGADNSEWGSGVSVAVADKDALLEKIAEINEDKDAFFAETPDGSNETAYNKALEVLKNITASQSEVDEALEALGGQADTEEDRLQKAKASAVEALNAYALEDYREAEQQLLIEYRAEGIAAIEAAATVEEVDSALSEATAKIEALTTAEEYEAIENIADADITDIYEKTGKYLNGLGIPSVGSIGGEWIVIGLSRAGYGVSTEWSAGYYANAVAYVEENINDYEQLHSYKSTDNSRLILALTATGRDVTDVGGHNLLTALGDLDYLKKQGNNGPIWALIALDSHDYEIPQAKTGGTQATRENIVETILAAQLSDGGWDLSGTGSTSDVDLTAMAVQALAPYYLDTAFAKNSEVKTAVDKALAFLSEQQSSIGGYSSWGTANSESCAQVVVALTSLGINPDTDEDFIKNGYSVLDALLSFAVEDGGFQHIVDGGLDGMATEQGYYALASYYRLLDGKTTLYDMTDVEIMTSDEKVTEVQKLIDAISTPVAIEDADAVNTALNAYNALGAGEKAEVGTDRVNKLMDAVEALSDLEVESVEKLIDAIGTVTLDKEAQINKANTAYNTLTDEQKAKVENYAVLKKALEDLAALKAGDTDDGDTSGGNGNDGDTSGGSGNSGDTSGGSGSSGDTSGGSGSSGNTSGGSGSSGNTSGGSGSSGNTSGGSGNSNSSSGNKTGDDTEDETEEESASEENDPDNTVQAVIEQIDAIAKAVEADAEAYTEEQLADIIDAYRAYSELSEEEKAEVEASDSYEVFAGILENVGKLNHYDEPTGTDVRNNSEDVLPWYIRLIVRPQEVTEEQQEKVAEALGEASEIFTMNDIYFVNILDGSRWYPEDYIKVTIPMVDIGDYTSAVIVHITDKGKLELLEGTVSEGKITFKAWDFSLYGIAGSMETLDTLLTEEKTAVIWPWILLGILALAAAGVILYARKKKNGDGTAA